MRRVYAYENSRKITCCTQFWKEGEWEDSFSRRYSYDSNGNVIEELSLDFRNGEWLEDDRHIREHDELGRLTSSTWQLCRGGRWHNWNRNSYTYNAEGREAQRLIQIAYREIGSELSDYKKGKYTYNNEGQREYLTWYEIDADLGRWRLSKREVSRYDDQGQLIEVVYQQRSHCVAFKLGHEFGPSATSFCGNEFALGKGFESTRLARGRAVA
jgi:hypothetical protein